MGWLFTYGQTRKQLIHHLTTDWTTPQASHQCITHCTRGNVLWSVWEIYYASTGHLERYIRCDLMQRGRNCGWGYKDMDESMHPYYYSCPEKYLKGTAVLNQRWRDKVREYHVMRRARAGVRKTRKRIRLFG